MSEAAPPSPVPAAMRPFAGLQDFSDRLPAMLVKELRQGLRARMFVVPFLVLHGMLVLGTLASQGGGGGFFWFWLGLMLVALLPMRNLSALSDERQAHTLETLLLTRLTPWRIVTGKWCATFSLAALTGISALPYLMVRYLNDGSSFVLEGAALGGLLLLSGALTAVFTALSTVPSAVGRHVFGALVLLMVCGFGVVPLAGKVVDDPAQGLGFITAVIPVILWGALFCLWNAASTIAPAAANLTTPRRLTTVLAVLLAVIIHFALPRTGYIGWHALLVILTCSSLVEMGDRLSWIPVTAVAFGRRGRPGRLAALILHPGWPTGVVFSALLWAFATLTFRDGRPWRDFAEPVAFCFCAVCGAAPWLFRNYSGAGLLILIAAASHFISIFAGALLPEKFSIISEILPSLNSSLFIPAAALGWLGAAFLLAAGPLFKLVRHISRESNL